MGNIVVGVDGSECAGEALRWAVEEARLRGWSVSPVMAWSYVAQIHVEGPEFEPGYGEPQARAALTAMVEQAVGDDPGVEIRSSVVCDLPVPALLDAGAEADLLVVGGRGLGGVRGLLLGSVSQGCVHRSSIPLVVVHQRSEPVGHDACVVVGIDGSPESLSAAGWAVEEARLRQAPLELLTTWQVPVSEIYPWMEPVDSSPAEGQAHELLDQTLEQLDTTGLGHRVRRNVVLGGPIPALLEASSRARLVVVGGRRVSGFAGMLLGSVSHALVHKASCPVLLLPT